MKPTVAIPVAIVVAGIIVAAAVYLSMAESRPKLGDSTGNPSLVRPVAASDHILGNPAAPIKIIEYSDFDCEHCKYFHDILHQIVANEGASGDVAWVYRHFPLTEIHPDAFKHARAAECAAATAGNDAFWDFATALYKNQPVGPSEYGTIAGGAGIRGDSFATCYATASTTLDARIAADRQNALDIGARGTPYSIILIEGSAGWRTPIIMDGAYSYDAVRQLINQALLTQ